MASAAAIVLLAALGLGLLVRGAAAEDEDHRRDILDELARGSGRSQHLADRILARTGKDLSAVIHARLRALERDRLVVSWEIALDEEATVGARVYRLAAPSERFRV